jgi:hypothetical protein
LIQNRVKLEGNYNGDIDNFVLDTEVVTVGTPSYQLVLAFDIIDISSDDFSTCREAEEVKSARNGPTSKTHIFKDTSY